MPVMLFFAMAFEHSIVNMFLFPFALMIGGDFFVMDYIIWNELPGGTRQQCYNGSFSR